MTGGNGAHHPERRRAEDRDESLARETAWGVFAEAITTPSTTTREAFELALGEYRRELATAAVRRLGMVATKPDRGART